MRKALALMFVTAALAVGLWVLLRSQPEPTTAVAPSAGSASAPATQSPSKPAERAPSAAQASDAAPTAQSSAADSEAIAKLGAASGGAPEKGPASVFAERYAGRSRQELIAARDALETRVNSDREALLRERLAAGYGVVLRPGDAAPAIPKNAAGREAVSIGATSTLAEGATEMRLAWLPFEEYADFYAALDELDWLKGQTR